MAKKSLTEAVSAEIKSKFNLDTFKAKKGLDTHMKFKEQTWIPLSKTLQEAINLPGIPINQVSVYRGRSDAGKSTLLIETAISAQKMGILPVIIITEMKNDMGHWKKMGFECEAIPDPNNPENITYNGNFLYADRSTLNSIEDISDFIIDLLDEQKKGNLPYDLLFLWDSVGSIPCRMSIENGSNNSQWNAGAMSTNFGNFVNQKFPMSRKADYPYNNTFVVVQKTGVMPAETRMSQPKMTNKGGDTMYWDAMVVITFGNVTNSGTSKLKAVKDKKNVEWAKKTKIAVDKIHGSDGIVTRSTVIMTPHGFIEDSPTAIEKYKKQYAKTWFSNINDISEITFEEDNSEWEEKSSPNVLSDDED